MIDPGFKGAPPLKINLLDPGLTSVAGHHFDIDLRVARQLLQDGHELHVYAHASASKAIIDEMSTIAPISRLFRAGPYDIPSRFDPVAGELLVYQNQSTVLAQDLTKVAEADLWLWPSIFAPQLNACASASRGVPIAGCVHTDVQAEEWPSGAMFWRHALLRAQRAGMPLRLGAIEPEHRYGFLPLTTDDRFELFPIPHEGSPRPQVSERLATVGFLGHQRREKGVLLVSEIVKRLLEQGYQVVFQDSANRQFLPEHAALTRIGFVPRIGDAIAKCDLVVLPYDPARYRSKGSGILWESLATGVPVVAPFGTAPGRWIEATGAGTLFSHANADAITGAIRRAGEVYPTIARAAAQVAREWPKRHGVERFVRAMTAPMRA